MKANIHIDLNDIIKYHSMVLVKRCLEKNERIKYTVK